MPPLPRLVTPAFPFVVSGPSGVGKTVLCRALLERLPRSERSISATTRPQRAGEVDGESYFFYSAERFHREREANGMAEWAEVHGHLYGTPKAWLDQKLEAGITVVLNIDVQGGMNIRLRYPGAVLVFLLPPSIEELEHRLRGRKTDSDDEIRRRLNRALSELQMVDRYDYALVNGDLEEAMAELLAIARAERARVARCLPSAANEGGSR